MSKRVNWRCLHQVTTVGLLALSLFCAHVMPAAATGLKFEFEWGGNAAQPGSYQSAGNGWWIPDEHGDRVNGLDQNDVVSDDFGGTDWYNFHYTENGEGFTPNVVLGQSAAGFRHWSNGYGALSHAAYFSNNGFPPPAYTHYETFTVDPGFNVTLSSLQIDRYTGADTSTVTVNVYAGSDPQNLGAQLFTSGLLSVAPGDTQTVTPNVTSHGLTLAYVFADESSFFSFDYWATDNIIFSQSVAPGVPGDFDSDGDVDGADFVAWQTNFPKASGATLAEGDADADGDVDGADFVVWQTNFPFTPGPGASPVPEPSVALLALGSAVPLVAGRCRRKRGN